ncbi:MAG: hypothetical protein ABIP53_02485 [Candidatus Limnocylindrales bacterium]
MPDRLNRVIVVTESAGHVDLPWGSRVALLGQLRRHEHRTIRDAFTAVGASFPVQFETLEDKAELLRVIEAWRDKTGGYAELPEGIHDLRNALTDDIRDAAAPA